MRLYSIIYSPVLDKVFAWHGLTSYGDEALGTRKVVGVIEAVSPEMAIKRWLAEAD